MNNNTKNEQVSGQINPIKINQQISSTEVKQKKISKEKKHNSFLRNSNRKPKASPETASTSSVPAIAEISSFPKENLNSPEYCLFSHLRQKTGNHPAKFWENLELTLKGKSFLDIKRADMTLVSYAALYESIEIFATLLDQYGSIIPQQEIETSIFKLSTNKNPLILQHTINFYTKLYQPTDDFIEDFLKLVGKASYREEANQLLINWLAPLMSDNNKKIFWNVCLENKNICFINIALHNTVLHTYLKENETQFEGLILKSGRQHTIKNSFNIAPIMNNKVISLPSFAIESNHPVVSIKTKHPKIKLIDASTKALSVSSKSVQEVNLENPVMVAKNTGTEIIIKRKRKIG